MITRILAAGAVTALMGSAAIAAPISLNYDGKSTSSTGEIIRIQEAPVSIAGQSAPRDVYGYGFKMSDADNVIDDFIAWCLDLTTSIKTNADYELTKTPFEAFTINKDAVQSLFDAVYASVDETNSVDAAAFQLALWEVGYDDDYSLTNNTQGVEFRGIGRDNNAVTTTAAGYITAAEQYTGDKNWKLSFLQSLGDPDSQSLVTATPVPLPAAGFLLLGGLAGLAAMRRKQG